MFTGIISDVGQFIEITSASAAGLQARIPAEAESRRIAKGIVSEKGPPCLQELLPRLTPAAIDALVLTL